MKTRVLAVCMVAAVSAVGSVAQAGTMDWNAIPSGTIDQQQTDTSEMSWALSANVYNWTRAVSLWQEFVAGTSGDLTAINLYSRNLSSTAYSFDLNVYAGRGVAGTLLGSTTFTSLANSQGTFAWRPFTLETPVALVAGGDYTFSIENSSMNSPMRITSSPYNQPPVSNAYPAGSCMWQGYQMVSGDYADPTGALNTSSSFDVSFQTVVVPEPATMAMLALGGMAMLKRRHAAAQK